MNAQSNGRVKILHLSCRKALLQQLLFHKRRPAPATHHTQIGVALPQNLFQADEIVTVSAAHDHKIRILIAVHCVQPLFEAVADHPLRS